MLTIASIEITYDQPNQKMLKNPARLPNEKFASSCSVLKVASPLAHEPGTNPD